MEAYDKQFFTPSFDEVWRIITPNQRGNYSEMGISLLAPAVRLCIYLL
jgi:hypothetical protein